MESQNNSNKQEYGLVMAFINQQPDFAYGFECGLLCGKLEHSEDLTNELYNTENAAQIEILLKHYGYIYTMTALDCGWILVNGSQIKGKFN